MTFTNNGLSGGHQRIVTGITRFGQCIGNRSEIHTGNGTQMHHIVIPLTHQRLLSAVRITVRRNMGNHTMSFFVKADEIFVIRDAQGEKGTAWNGNGRNDIHPVMKHHLLLFVNPVAKLVYLVSRTHHGIKIIQKKDCPRSFAAVRASVQSISVVTAYHELTKVSKKRKLSRLLQVSTSMICFIIQQY